MKKLILFFAFASALLSCNSDNDNPSIANMDGSWHMVSYVAFMNSLPVFDSGDIIWTFNSSNNNVTIVNTVESEYPYIQHSGSFSLNATTSQVNIDGNLYDYSFQNGVLTLDSNIGDMVDGAVMTFEKQ